MMSLAFPDPDTASSRLKVSLLAYLFPVYSETFVSELARGLIAAGCALNVHTLQPAARGAVAPTDVPVSRPGLPAWLPASLAGPALIPARARMLRRAGRLDVVHCQFATIALSALRHLRIGALRTRAFVVHLRGYDITTFVEERGPDIYAPVFARADLMIANCRHFRDRAVALGCPPEKIVVIGSPIDTSRFAAPDEPRAAARGRATRLVAVGRLVEKKGFADAIDAVARLTEAGRNVTLEILGDGPLRADLERRIARAGLGGHVTLAGAVDPGHVLAALHRADIALAPSVRATTGDEDAPVNTVKEALATELPVVATRHGGIPELVIPGENGALVPERDPAAMAHAIAEMMDNPLMRAELGRAGRRKVVEEFDHRRIVQATLEAYHLAVSKSGEMQ